MCDRELTLRLRRLRREEPAVVPRDDAVLGPEGLDRGHPRVEAAAETVREDEGLVAGAEHLVGDARSVLGDDASLLDGSPPSVAAARSLPAAGDRSCVVLASRGRIVPLGGEPRRMRPMLRSSHLGRLLVVVSVVLGTAGTALAQEECPLGSTQKSEGGQHLVRADRLRSGYELPDRVGVSPGRALRGDRRARAGARGEERRRAEAPRSPALRRRQVVPPEDDVLGQGPVHHACTGRQGGAHGGGGHGRCGEPRRPRRPSRRRPADATCPAPPAVSPSVQRSRCSVCSRSERVDDALPRRARFARLESRPFREGSSRRRGRHRTSESRRRPSDRTRTTRARGRRTCRPQQCTRCPEEARSRSRRHTRWPRSCAAPRSRRDRSRAEAATSSGQSAGVVFTQSNPPVQPFAPLIGTILPSGQNPGAGGESTGHEMQHATPTPPPHETFEASAQ